MLRLLLIFIISLGSVDLAFAIPANAYVIGDQWYCDSGFKRTGNRCVDINVPSNAYAIGDQWYCDSGFKRTGNRCVDIFVAESEYAKDGNSFCSYGYVRKGNKCVEVDVPRNATLSDSGRSWNCNKGFTKSGNTCLKIAVSKNPYATDGNSFCSYGYVRKGNKCVEVNYPKDKFVMNTNSFCEDGYERFGDKCIKIANESSEESNPTEEKRVQFKFEGESSADIQLRLEKEKELIAKISELELKAKETKTTNETLLKTSEEYEAYKVVQEKQLNRKEEEYIQLSNDFGDLQDAYAKLKAENQEKEEKEELRQQQELKELEAQVAVIEKRIKEGEIRVEEITQSINDLINQKYRIEASILSFESEASDAARDKLVKTEELNNVIAQIVKAKDLLARYKSNENRLQALVDSDQLMLGLKIIIGFLFVLLLISFKSRRKFNKKALQESDSKPEFQGNEEQIKEPEEESLEEPEEESLEEPKEEPKEENNRLAHLKLIEFEKWTQEWNEWISAGISSFDASSVMNKNRFRSSKELIKEKKDKNLKYLDNELVALSELDKQALKSYRSYRSKNKLTNLKHFSFEDIENPGLISTIMMTPDHQSALEIKTDESSYHLANNDGHILPATVIELQHQMMITGLKQIHYWCYLKGYDGILIKVDRNDTLINELLDLELKIYSKIIQ